MPLNIPLILLEVERDQRNPGDRDLSLQSRCLNANNDLSDRERPDDLLTRRTEHEPAPFDREKIFAFFLPLRSYI